MYRSIGFIAEQISWMFMKQHHSRICEMNHNDKRPVKVWKISFLWYWYVFKEMTVWARSILEKSLLRHVCLAITTTKGSNPIIDMGNRTKPKKAIMNIRAEVFPISLRSFEKLSIRKDNGNLLVFDLINFSILEVFRLRNSTRMLIELSPTGGSTIPSLESIPMVAWYSSKVGVNSYSPNWKVAVETS